MSSSVTISRTITFHESAGLQNGDELWMIKMKAVGSACYICGAPPVYAERAEFYESGLCADCADAVAEVDSRAAYASAHSGNQSAKLG